MLSINIKVAQNGGSANIIVFYLLISYSYSTGIEFEKNWSALF